MIRILFLIALAIGLSESGKYMRLTNCECYGNNEYVNFKKCSLKAISREKVTTTVEVDLKKEVRNATCHFAVQKMTSTGRYFPYLYDIWVNVCEAVRERFNTNFIVRQMKRILAKYSNAVICGHKENSYYFRNVELQFEVLKFLFADGRYKMKFEFYEGIKNKTVDVANYTVVFDILEKFERPKKQKKALQKE